MQEKFHTSHLIRLASLLTCLWIFASCIDTFDADLPSSESTYIVVEGSICGDSDCTFTLSKSLPLNPSAQDILNRFIANASVKVCGSDNTQYTAHYTWNGIYKVHVGSLNPNQEYWLEILWDGHTFASTPTTPLPTPEIKDLSYERTNGGNTVQIMVTPAAPLHNETQFYIWNYKEDWEIQTPYSTKWEYDKAKKEIVELKVDLHRGWCNDPHHTSVIGENTNYENGEIRNLRLYAANNMDNRFNHLYCTTVTQRAVSREEYEYERLSQRQSEEMGGLFTPQPSELPTNIHCTNGGAKAIGYIGVSLNSTFARLFIKSSDVGYRLAGLPHEPSEDESVLPYDMLYEIGYRVWEYNFLSGGVIWIERWGVDCTAWGASLTAPDFWPNK